MNTLRLRSQGLNCGGGGLIEGGGRNRVPSETGPSPATSSIVDMLGSVCADRCPVQLDSTINTANDIVARFSIGVAMTGKTQICISCPDLATTRLFLLLLRFGFLFIATCLWTAEIATATVALPDPLLDPEGDDIISSSLSLSLHL